MPFHPATRSRHCADETGTSPHPKVERRPDLPRARACTVDLGQHSQSAQISRADAEPSQAPDPDLFREDLLRLLPELRHFARSVTRVAEEAEDLVQETLLRAWQSQDRYRLGSDLKAWTFAMMRNSFSSTSSDGSRPVPDDGVSATGRSTLKLRGGHAF